MGLRRERRFGRERREKGRRVAVVVMVVEERERVRIRPVPPIFGK